MLGYRDRSRTNLAREFQDEIIGWRVDDLLGRCTSSMVHTNALESAWLIESGGLTCLIKCYYKTEVGIQPQQAVSFGQPS